MHDNFPQDTPLHREFAALEELASGTYKKLGHTSRSQLDPEQVEILDGKSDHLSITLLAYVNHNLFRVPEGKI